MSAPASPTVPVLAGRIAVPLSAREARLDPALTELVERLTEGDTEAMRALAEKLAPRVRRVAQALMGRSPDADDAAQHALIELLRAYPRAGAEQGFERWADRHAALSVLRFARAVRRRGPAGPDVAAAPEGDERASRSFESYLHQLTEPSREVLLLRHALGFRFDELPDALRCSARAAKERLLGARSELRALVRRRVDAGREPGERVLRWCALRDREALDEALDASERAEVEALEESEAAVWAYVAQVRALELYFASHARALQDEDRALIDAALPGVQVTSKAVLARALEGADDLERALDTEESGWSRAIAIGGSALLVVGCAVALLLRVPADRPPATRRGASARPVEKPATSDSLAAPVSPRLDPTVEPLTSARVSSRGGHLRGEESLLGLGAPVGQGMQLETLDRPACLTVGGASELCLAPTTTARIVSLVAREPRVELLRGRMLARALDARKPQPLVVEVASLRASVAGGALAVERAAEQESARLRAVRGRFDVVTARGARALEEGHGISLGADAHSLLVSALAPAIIQRDLDLIAQAQPSARPPPSGTALRTPASSAKPSQASSEEASDRTATPSVEVAPATSSDAGASPDASEEPSESAVAPSTSTPQEGGEPPSSK